MTPASVLISYEEIELYGDIGLEDEFIRLGLFEAPFSFEPRTVVVALIECERFELHNDLDDNIIEGFKESMLAGDPIPRVILIDRRDHYTVPDGYHRMLAYQDLGVKTIEALIVVSEKL